MIKKKSKINFILFIFIVLNQFNSNAQWSIDYDGISDSIHFKKNSNLLSFEQKNELNVFLNKIKQTFIVSQKPNLIISIHISVYKSINEKNVEGRYFKRVKKIERKINKILKNYNYRFVISEINQIDKGKTYFLLIPIVSYK